MTTPSADLSAKILTNELLSRKPFLYLRYGDGALENIYNMRPGSCTCDGEQYTKGLGDALLASWIVVRTMEVAQKRSVFIGDWLTASFDGPATHVQQWEEMIKCWSPALLHFEALLLMRESAALQQFYQTVRVDPRRKLYMGPAGNAGAAKMLGASHLVTPMTGLDASWRETTAAHLMRMDFDVLLFGAGMAGCVPVIECWYHHPERTYIHLGSALDILFRGRSRKQQLDQQRARAFFEGML